MIDKRIFHDIAEEKKRLLFILISNIIQAFLLTAASYTIAYLADRLLFSQLTYAAAAPLLVLLLFCFSARAYLRYFNHTTIKNISIKLQSKLRRRLLTALAYAADKTARREGEWLALITKGVDKLDTYVTGFLPQLAILITLPPTLLICALLNDWISGAIFLTTAPLIPLFMILIGKLADKENKRQWQLFQKLTNYMADLLPGLLVLKVYNQIDCQLHQAAANGRAFSNATLKVLKIAFISAFMLEFIATLSIAIIAVNIGLRLLYGDAVFLPAFFILLIAPQFYTPFRQFGAAFHDAMNGITAAAEIYTAANNLHIKQADDLITPRFTQPMQIIFNKVNFSYAPKEQPLLWQQLSFTIPAGKQTVLIGNNGVGKSTILKLLLKTLALQQGSIQINNLSLAALNPKTWREQIGYAAQNPYVFSATVAENIALGRPCKRQDIIKAAKTANLDSFIATLPHGYDTILGTEQKLSFGQKRRLGIARALLTEPKLLLFDEPMENLDSNNEQLIQHLLDDLKGKATVIIIAHRWQTIKHADHIILLADGHAVTYENFAEIPQNLHLTKGGYYSDC